MYSNILAFYLFHFTYVYACTYIHIDMYGRQTCRIKIAPREANDNLWGVQLSAVRQQQAIREKFLHFTHHLHHELGFLFFFCLSLLLVLFYILNMNIECNLHADCIASIGGDQPTALHKIHSCKILWWVLQSIVVVLIATSSMHYDAIMMMTMMVVTTQPLSSLANLSINKSQQNNVCLNIFFFLNKIVILSGLEYGTLGCLTNYCLKKRKTK